MDRGQFVETVDVPRNTGVDGFVTLVRSILKIGGVQDIHINATGRVTYKYVAERREPVFNPEQLFDQVSPAYIVRNSELREVGVVGTRAFETLFLMMRYARLDNVEPIAWVVGANTMLPKWLAKWSDVPEAYLYPNDMLLGLQVLKDRVIPDESLTLCAGASRGADLLDTTKSYKIAMVM